MAIRASAADVDLGSSLVFPAIHIISPRTNDKQDTQDITNAEHSRGVCPEDMKMIFIIKLSIDGQDMKMIKWIWKWYRGYENDLRGVGGYENYLEDIKDMKRYRWYENDIEEMEEWK